MTLIPKIAGSTCQYFRRYTLLRPVSYCFSVQSAAVSGFSRLINCSGQLLLGSRRINKVNLTTNLSRIYIAMAQSRPSSDMAKFREHFAKAKHIVVLTGAGVSAESGVPTFRGAGGYWRRWQAQDLASPEAFWENPSLVWEFYHYRREVMESKKPNAAHIAIAECEKRLAAEGRRLVVITQNIDELHRVAGTKNILELHGSLFKTQCTKCGDVRENKDSPICPALKDKGEPDPSSQDAKIPEIELPRCQKAECGGLLRPHVIWFGEPLDTEVMKQTHIELETCDLCLVVGTSSVVYPAAMFAPQVAYRGVPVAEFNIEVTPATSSMGFMFKGPAGQTIPTALAPTGKASDKTS